MTTTMTTAAVGTEGNPANRRWAEAPPERALRWEHVQARAALARPVALAVTSARVVPV